MIMRKLYIPTSTFNFNNILSSESISPKAFYERRGFGYSRWLEIPENGNLNNIILYEQPFEFNRPESETEDHPMLIEIETDENFKLVADGIYCCDHTIYLSPWTTKFIFFSEQDKRVTLSLSDSSLETKLIRIYEKQLVIGKYPKNTNSVPSDCDVPFNPEAITNDYRLNKMKGLLYGYYIGAMLSTSVSLTKKHNILSELQDIFSAVLSSENNIPTVAQEERMKVLLRQLQRTPSWYQRLLKCCGNDETLTNKLINGLRGDGVTFPDAGINKEQILYMLSSKKDDKEDNRALVWLKDEQNKLKRQIQKERSLLMPADKEIVTVNLSLKELSDTAISDAKENLMIKAWINEVISNDYYNGNISSCKEKLSDEVTKKAKELYNESWDGSPMKSMLNDMRRYVRGQENNMSWNNYVIASIASVLAKGNDWEQLLSFMKSKSISDYRLAFAFYGELNGFANLTRDFTDNIFNLDDKNYIAGVYQEIDEQLLGCKHVDTIKIDFVDNPSRSMDNVAFKDDKDDMVMDDEFDLHQWQENIRLVAKGFIKKNKDKLMSSLEEAFIQNGNERNYFKFITLLDNFDGWKPTKNGPSKAWERLQRYFVPDYYNKIGFKYHRKDNESKHQEVEFQFGSSINDNNKSVGTFEYNNINSIIELIKNNFPYLATIPTVIHNVQEDLKWALEPKYSTNKSKTTLVEMFKKKLSEGKNNPKGSKGGDMRWKNELYRSLDIDAIIDLLNKNF